MGNPLDELGVFKSSSDGGGMRVGSLLMHKRADFFTFHHATQIANDVHVEDIDRQVVVVAHADG